MHHHLMTHDGRLVVLSFAAAFFASYTALDMGTRLRRAAGKQRKLWLCGSSVVLGGGIWSMHFVGMLAFDAGAPVGYDFDLTVLSLFIAIVFVAVGLHIVTRANPSMPRLVVAGGIVGCGVASMHYTGMSALILAGTIHYDPVLVVTSVLIAIVAATAALWLTLNLTSPWQRVAAAAIMAFAVCGMHYNGMMATSITLAPGQLLQIHPLSRPVMAAAVSLGLFLILCLAMVGVFVDRRFEFVAEREAEFLRAANRHLRGEIEERKVIALELLETNTQLIETRDAIRNLLDNADQGFLTVGPELLVGDQSSAACEAILGQASAGKPIIELLCPARLDGAASAMHATLVSVFRESSDFVRELKLSLLPEAFHLGGKSVKASYKFLAGTGRLMVILTDVTQTVLLTEAIERERQRLELIVFAFTEGASFAALINDYRTFLTGELPRLIQRIELPEAQRELSRLLHTYKGLLAQYSFHHAPRCLHDVETRLRADTKLTVQMARDAVRPEELLTAFNRDVAYVTDVLGTDFMPSGRCVMPSQRQVQTMEQIARNTLASVEGHAASQPLRELLQMLASLGMLDAKAALALHGRGAVALAGRLQKQLAPISVGGDDAALPPELYGDFFHSLVHVFRNAVDHGIEAPDERLLAGKPADGAIRCDFLNRGDCLEIVIQDDGAGVDRGALEDRLVASGKDRARVENLALEDLVFREGLSARDTANQVSGRGIGLAAVKAELDNLGGSVTVETERGAGTRFRFRLPSTEVSNVIATERNNA